MSREHRQWLGSVGEALPLVVTPQPEDEAVTWAVSEFGDAILGDARRTSRLVQVARTLSARPTVSLPQSCQDPAALKGAYRFFANTAVAPAAILAPHVEATLRRMAAVPLVLAVQDTTELDYTAHPATTGLGPLSDTRHHGLLVHTTMAFTPEKLPLGVLAQQVWARDAATFGKLADHKTRPIAEKESAKWLGGLQAASAAHAACPTTTVVVVGDRESDVYDLFVAPRPPGVDLLVRAAWDRRVEHPERYLWAAVGVAPVAATVVVAVPPRRGTGRRPAQLARTATVTLRFCSVSLRPPKHRTAEHLPAVVVAVVWAQEQHPPAGVEPLSWLLLSTRPVPALADALERVRWYGVRWGIEVIHKILKSGCGIETRQLLAADRLQRCLAVSTVVAWRILFAAILARSLPTAPCTVLLDEAEWQALCCRIYRVATPPPAPPTLRQAIRWIAQLGGYIGRRRDPAPGVTVLWRGFHELQSLTDLYRILKPPAPRSLVGNS